MRHSMFSVKLMCRNFIDLLNEFYCMVVVRVCLLLLRLDVYIDLYHQFGDHFFSLSQNDAYECDVVQCSVERCGETDNSSGNGK